jgi:hypothetical protein
MAIALTAATVVASLNYIPWWYKPAAAAELVLRKSLPLVGAAYKELARSNGGLPPTVTGAADGGFSAAFLPLLNLPPAAPRGYGWSYHRHPVDSSDWSGLNYLCLSSAADGNISSWKGFRRVHSVYSTAQVVLGSACGATANVAEPEELPAPLALTFFVTYVPGVD